MSKKIINTPDAPAPIGPYSQAILAGDTLYLAGQICIDAKTGELKNSDVREETRQSMLNLQYVLQAAGMSFANVVKTTIFITDMKQFPEINEEYGKFFEKDFPPRETVQVAALPKSVRVEISMIAVK